MYQIKWEFLAKNSLIPLVEIKGSAENIKLENIMIAKALSIIQQAEYFKGRVMATDNINNTNSRYFYLSVCDVLLVYNMIIIIFTILTLR